LGNQFFFFGVKFTFLSGTGYSRLPAKISKMQDKFLERRKEFIRSRHLQPAFSSAITGSSRCFPPPRPSTGPVQPPGPSLPHLPSLPTTPQKSEKTPVDELRTHKPALSPQKKSLDTIYSSTVPKFSEPEKKNPMVDELRTHKPFPPPKKKTLGVMYNSIEPEFPQPVPEKKKKFQEKNSEKLISFSV
jgi:hypothetical protein